jgi:hypothetical protein
MSPKKQHKMEVIIDIESARLNCGELQRRDLRRTNLQGQAIMPVKLQRQQICKVNPQDAN